MITIPIQVPLNAAEELKYQEALSGVLELGDGEVRGFEDTKALTSLIYCQEVVNSLTLLRFKEGYVVTARDSLEGATVGPLSSKERALLDLCPTLAAETVVVHSRYRSLARRLSNILRIAARVVTSSELGSVDFADVTALVFFDTPPSHRYHDAVARLGSAASCYHLLASLPDGTETIDHRRFRNLRTVWPIRYAEAA